MVKWTSKLAVLALALSLWASPLMACMLPDATLTVEERECCLTMANDCGDMEMPASHSCCTVTVREASPYLVKARFAASHSQPAGSILDVAKSIPSLESFSPVEKSIMAHSPPVSPPQSLSVLRI